MGLSEFGRAPKSRSACRARAGRRGVMDDRGQRHVRKRRPPPQPMHSTLRISLPLARSFTRATCQRRNINLIFTSPKSLSLKFSPAPKSLARQVSPFSTSARRNEEGSEPKKNKLAIRENIYTIPNILTVSRIAATPVLGWAILEGNYELATGLLAYAGLTDLVRSPSHKSGGSSNASSAQG